MKVKNVLLLVFLSLVWFSCKRKGFDRSKNLQEPQFKTSYEEGMRKLSATDSVVFASHSIHMTSGYIKSETNRLLMFKYYFKDFTNDDAIRMEEICANILNQMKKEVVNTSEFEGVSIEFFDGDKRLKEKSCFYTSLLEH